MPQRILRLVALGSNDITFADPSAVTRTTRFVHSFAKPKTVIGPIDLHRFELISNRDVDVEKAGCADACSAVSQPISVRVKVSHPLEATAETKQAIIDALENMKLAVESGLTDGFLPNGTATFYADFGVA